MKLIRSLSLLLLLVSSIHASAFESRFAIDPAIDLPGLSRTGEIPVKTERRDGLYYSDASAVLKEVDFARLASASVDFDRYAEMGMPNVRESRIVVPGADELVTWTRMSALGQSSEHYLQVRVIWGIAPNDGEGTEWELIHRQATWPFEEATPFERLDGSWYMEPLANGQVYVRYFGVAKVHIALPDFLVSGFLRQ